MNLKSNLAYLVLLCIALSCKGQTSSTEKVESSEISKTNKFDIDSLLSSVKFLSADALEGRRAGEPGSAKARAYIISKFKAHGVLPLVENYEQPFVAETRNGATYNSTNVLGLIKGSQFPDKYVVISAHYDHDGIRNNEIYNGADDNASGTSALFSFAEYLKGNPPKHSIILAAFDAEELGLLGAYHFTENSIVDIKHIVANLNMDMISRSDSNTLWAVGPRYFNETRAIISKLDSTETFKVKIGHEGLDDSPNWLQSSDQAAFHESGIPFLFFTVDDHKDYHKPTDDFENIDPIFYANSVKAIISIFDGLDAIILRK